MAYSRQSIGYRLREVVEACSEASHERDSLHNGRTVDAGRLGCRGLTSSASVAGRGTGLA